MSVLAAVAVAVVLLAIFEVRSSSGCHVRLVAAAAVAFASAACRRTLRRRRFAYCLFMYEGP